MNKYFYQFLQITWGAPQTLGGLMLFLKHYHELHFNYHGAVATQWKNKGGLSLGMFIFVPEDSLYHYDHLKSQYSLDEFRARLCVHEYGHTIQSLILGPFYFLLIGLPSILWGAYYLKRKNEKLAYSTFFIEKWANELGEKFTHEISPRDI